MTNTISIAKLIGALFFVVSIVTGCSSGGDSTSTFTVGGTVSGLAGSGLVLQNNAGDDLAISADGSFSFATALANGAAYAVTVATQPSAPNQICTVANGSGTLSGANITNVAITCTNTYTVGGTVTGLAGTGLVLQNNGGDDLAIDADGSFAFSTALVDGSGYDVTVSSQPSNPNQTCTVTNESGTLSGNNISNVAVTCINTYTVGGTVSGLAGTGLELQNNGGDPLAIDANGSYTFATPLVDGSGYAVTVTQQPGGQTCIATNGSGTLSGANVTNVAITCNVNPPNTYTITGEVNGLAGTGLQLYNGYQTLDVSLNGGFTFTALDESTVFQVTVTGQPSGPNQICAVTSGGGSRTLTGDVNDVIVTCTTTQYAISGTLTNYTGDGLVLNNGVDSLPIPAGETSFIFPALDDGTAYTITFPSQPSGPDQTCSATSGGSGTLSGAAINDIAITCTTTQYTISGTLTGYAGDNLVLNNGVDSLPIPAGGTSFIFPALDDGSSYNVTVTGQPSGPVQNCLVSNGSGTLSGDNVANVSILCTSSVAALYSNGANWNDYVINNGPNSDWFLADNTACTGTENSYAGCLHGGEMRVVTLAGYSSCTDLTAADTLDAFNWRCDESTDPVRFISTGLREDKNLSDLIDFTTPGWLDNAVTISELGTPIAETPATAWWTNQIIIANAGGSLATAGTIYLKTNSAVANYTIDANKVGFVIQPGMQVTGTGAGGGSDSVSAAVYNFLWLEGDIDGAGNYDGGGNDTGVRWTNVSHSVMRDVRVTGTGRGLDGAIYLDISSNNLLKHIRVVRGVDQGIVLINSSYNTISNVIATNNRIAGITVKNNSDHNLIANFVSANNNNETGSSGAGIFVGNGSDDNKFINVTSVNNRQSGLNMEVSSGNLLMNMVFANNFTSLFVQGPASRTTVADFVSTDNRGHSVLLNDVSENKFTGIFKIGNNLESDCVVNDFTPDVEVNPGLVTDTCTTTGTGGSSFYGANNALSDATLHTPVTTALSFGGMVTSDDIANTSDDNGGKSGYTNITDWLNFDNVYRGWGLDSVESYPDVHHAGSVPGCYIAGVNAGAIDAAACALASGDWLINARIWDWSLVTGDTGDAYTGGPAALNVLGVPTGNLTITHTWSDDTPSSPFLRHAVEILGDAIGNNDGLCETNEACIYTPNIGAYQGHGTLDPVAFTDGAISGVQLYQYGSNGDL